MPWHFSPGLIVGSFFASLTGTVLCVELLHRKRLGKSGIARIQLLLCAIAMGLIGIWCMHFIGNRSVVLGDGSPQIQLEYSPGYTILSCILPVLGLSVAFYIAELRISNKIVRRFLDIITGLLAGSSIVGMHYCGNVGTSNYDLHYPAHFIVAAAIIAIGDCIIALMLFFYFKEHWINVLWKRLCIAGLLSVAVCGMHYTATVGCTYRLLRLNKSASSRDVPFILAGVLCCASAVITIIILCYTSLRMKSLASKAQQVNVACAYFDDDGNIMVSSDGFLPLQKIAKRFDLQTFDDDFTTGHPVFHWIWKVSHDWESVYDLIPRMKSHLKRHDTLGRPTTRPGTSSSTQSGASFDEESYNDQTLLFREGFCVAVAELADRLHLPLTDIGRLYDRITGTGVMAPTSAAAKKMSQIDAASIASSSGGHLEKGQILFFTRKIRREEMDRFAAAGFRFAPPNRVETMIARTMQLPIASVAGHIKSLHEHASNANVATLLKQGTYLTCFAALGRVNKHFDVLVSTTYRDQLPDMQLTPQHLTTSQLNFLKLYDGWSAGRMVHDLRQKRAREHSTQPEEQGFILLLINSMSSLSHQISEEWFNDLVFNAKPIISQYNTGSTSTTTPAMIFGLTKLLDIHQSLVNQPERLTFVPLEFYRMRTSFRAGSAEISKFRAEVHTEFGPILTKNQAISGKGNSPKLSDEKSPRISVKPLSTAMIRKHLLGRKYSTGKLGDEESMLNEDSSSERGLVRPISPSSTNQHNNNNNIDPLNPHNPNKQLWGGILATTDTVIIETTTKLPTGGTDAVELKQMNAPRVTTTAVMERGHGEEVRTFADLLYAQAKYRGVSRPMAQGGFSHGGGHGLMQAQGQGQGGYTGQSQSQRHEQGSIVGSGFGEDIPGI